MHLEVQASGYTFVSCFDSLSVASSQTDDANAMSVASTAHRVDLQLQQKSHIL